MILQSLSNYKDAISPVALAASIDPLPPDKNIPILPRPHSFTRTTHFVQAFLLLTTCASTVFAKSRLQPTLQAPPCLQTLRIFAPPARSPFPPTNLFTTTTRLCVAPPSLSHLCLKRLRRRRRRTSAVRTLRSNAVLPIAVTPTLLFRQQSRVPYKMITYARFHRYYSAPFSRNPSLPVGKHTVHHAKEDTIGISIVQPIQLQ